MGGGLAAAPSIHPQRGSNSGRAPSLCVSRACALSLPAQLARCSSPAVGSVQAELLVPGLRTINVRIPVPSSIDTVKAALVRQVDEDLAAQGDPRRIGAAWAIFQTFGQAVEVSLQLLSVHCLPRRARAEFQFRSLSSVPHPQLQRE